MKPLLLIAGTRPEIIKLAPVIRWLQRLEASYVLVWSGQHYDYRLSGLFFEELGLPHPEEDLHVGSGTHAEQTGKCMTELESLLGKRSPSFVVGLGDTNTVLASALTAAKCLIPFAHIEAGLRSWDFRMPEEVNRRATDSIATILFAPTRLAAINLLCEGVARSRVYVTGNTIVDVVRECRDEALRRSERILSELSLERDAFILATLHRAENTDSPERLSSILKALEELSKSYPIVFPMHPRTRNTIARLGLAACLDGLKTMEPLGYLDFLGLLSSCLMVLTDSGGVQEEAFTLKTPTVTLRYNTERPETTIYGINVLAGADRERIVRLALDQAERSLEIRKLSFPNPLGDGLAGRRIAEALKEKGEAGLALEEPDLRDKPIIEYRLLDDGCRLWDPSTSTSTSVSVSVLDLLEGFTEDGRSMLPEGGRKVLARIKVLPHDKGPPDP
ncbi:MAG: UDP-N-acetylglucosamine 2-epimerase (non-hydrolyzing) [Candidatus Bathyarchaeia archaeon]